MWLWWSFWVCCIVSWCGMIVLSGCSVWYRVLYKIIYKTIKPIYVGSAMVISTNHSLNWCWIKLWELSSPIIRFLFLDITNFIYSTRYVSAHFLSVLFDISSASIPSVWHQLHFAGKTRPPAVRGTTLSPRRCQSLGWLIHSTEVCHQPMLLVSLPVHA